MSSSSEMASTVTERIELAKLCSSKDWSKAIRVLDSLLAQSCVIQDIWFIFRPCLLFFLFEFCFWNFILVNWVVFSGLLICL